MSNPVTSNGPIEGVKDALESTADKLPLPGPEKYKIVWLMVIIGGGGLLLLYLIHRNAQPAKATQPALPAQDILASTSSTATNPVASKPSTPSKPPVPLPGMGRVVTGLVNHGRPEQRQKTPSKPVTKPVTSHPSHTDYAVHSGDTLSGIASSHHTSVASLYNANRVTIDNTARQHGHSSNTIDWLYPGEDLVIP